MNGIDLYTPNKKEFATAKSVLVEAFSSDPFFQYMLNGITITESASKAVHSFILKLGYRYGKVYATSRSIEGVALWLPPGQTNITPIKSIMSGVMAIPFKLGRNITRFVKRMIAYSNYSEHIHKTHAPFPHWYLLAIGILEEHRGKGLASRLMNPMLEYFDHNSTSCYLETHNQNNIGLYQHFGFHIVEECRFPGTENPFWAMLRYRKNN